MEQEATSRPGVSYSEHRRKKTVKACPTKLGTKNKLKPLWSVNGVVRSGHLPFLHFAISAVFLFLCFVLLFLSFRFNFEALVHILLFLHFLIKQDVINF